MLSQHREAAADVSSASCELPHTVTVARYFSISPEMIVSTSRSKILNSR